MHRFCRRSLALAALSALFVAAPAIAQEAPAQAADAKVFSHVTLAPLDRLDATLARNGLPGVGDRLAGLISMIRLVGPQEVDRTRGTSVAFVAGEQVTRNDGTILQIPVVPTALPLANLQQMGAAAVPGHADAVAMGGMTLRRDATYLIFGGHQASVLGVAPAEIDASVRDERTLLAMAADLKTVRGVAPQALEAFLQESANKQPLPADPAAAASNQAGRDMFVNFIRGLDSMSLTLATSGAPAAGDAAGEAALVDVALAPIALKTVPPAAGLTRPAFPAGTVARVDWSYPSAEAASKITAVVLEAANSSKKLDTPEKQAEARALGAAVTDLFVGDATSWAVRYAPGEPTVNFAVVQWAGAAKPLAAKLDAFEAALAPIARQREAASLLKRSTYDAGGATVTRVDLLDDEGKREASVDFIEQEGGKRLLIAIAADEGRHLAALATLRAEAAAPLTHLVEAELDLPTVKQLVAALPPGQVPPAAAAALASLGDADRLTLTADGDGQTFKVRTSLPFSAITASLKSVMP